MTEAFFGKTVGNMDPNQYSYTGYTQQPPVYPPYPATHDHKHDQRVPYITHQYGQIPPPSFAAELPAPVPVIAELPAAFPAAPPTSTSPQQLTQDELLAHRLQNMEVTEARRRSSSNVSHQTSYYSLRGAASLSPQTSHTQFEAAPPLPPRPHPGSFSSIPAYGPDSYGPPPTSFQMSDGRAFGAGYHSHRAPSVPQTDSLPEVVVGPLPVTSSGVGESLPEVVVRRKPVSSSQADSLPEVAVGPMPISSSGVGHIRPVSTALPTASPPPAVMDARSLASYLEIHREVPRPRRWLLPPIVDTLYASVIRSPKATDWLEYPLRREWRQIRASQQAHTPVEPTYAFTAKTGNGFLQDPIYSWTKSAEKWTSTLKLDDMIGGGFLHDSRYSWTMSPEKWTYNVKFDDMTGQRRSEVLTGPNNIDIVPTYIPASNYDSLRFVGSDGRVYLWVAHGPLSSLHGARYDTLRHALFMAPKGCDPLYGEIVADHTYWDGFTNVSEVHRVKCTGCGASPINGLRWKCKSCADHNICEQCRLTNASVQATCSFTLANLPDEALYIRSRDVDPALVCATLQIMKDWELHSLRMQRKRDLQGFKKSEDEARKGEMGKRTYWKAGDELGAGTTVMEEQKKEPDAAKIAKLEKTMAKELKKAEKARGKEKSKSKDKDKGKGKDKKGSVLGVSELIRGSAQVGGSVGDVGEALRRDSRSSSGT